MRRSWRMTEKCRISGYAVMRACSDASCGTEAKFAASNSTAASGRPSGFGDAEEDIGSPPSSSSPSLSSFNKSRLSPWSRQRQKFQSRLGDRSSPPPRTRHLWSRRLWPCHTHIAATRTIPTADTRTLPLPTLSLATRSSTRLTVSG